MSAIINFVKSLLGRKKHRQNLNSRFKFNGGVHPPLHKHESTQQAIRPLPIPQVLILPLRQTLAGMPKIVVQVGAYVRKGQLLAAPNSATSAAIYAPTSGTVTAIGDHIVPHPSGLPDICVTLTADGKDTWAELAPLYWPHSERSQLVESLRLSGIVGLDETTFPIQVKVGNDGKSTLHSVVINAAESEPYITCDDMLMRERATEIVQGIAIVQYLLGAKQCIIGIEDNKPEAAIAMSSACASLHNSAPALPTLANISLKTLPKLYPSGNERLLIHLLLGIELPSGKLATDIGVQVFNVATVLAIYRYFQFGEPAISRIVTMTGNVASAGNFEVLFGTPLMSLVAAAGGAKADTTHYIMGGAMTGFDLPNSEVSIIPTTQCIIAASTQLFAPAPPAMPCIRCVRCIVNLQPQQLYKFTQSGDFASAADSHLFDCIECGCCSYVCPSNIPLVQYFRYAKSEIIAADQAKATADLARERYEFKLARIAREKLERSQKHVERAQLAKAKAKLAPAAAVTLPAQAATSHGALDQVAVAEQAAATAKLKRQALIAAAIARVQAQQLGTADAIAANKIESRSGDVQTASTKADTPHKKG
jgi:electron transport complex protein RnfC